MICSCQWLSLSMAFYGRSTAEYVTNAFFPFYFCQYFVNRFSAAFFTTTTFYFCFFSCFAITIYRYLVVGSFAMVQSCKHILKKNFIFTDSILYFLWLQRWKSRSFSSTFNAPCWFFADQSTVERMNEELKLYVLLRSNRIAHTGPFLTTDVPSFLTEK